MNPSYKPIKPLLESGSNTSSRWFSYAGLGIGVVLLLCSIQMYVNLQRLLRQDSTRKNGFDFVSVRKNVTNESMGNSEMNMFSAAEADELSKQNFIAGVAPGRSLILKPIFLLRQLIMILLILYLRLLNGSRGND
jgi:hypothetical protein